MHMQPLIAVVTPESDVEILAGSPAGSDDLRNFFLGGLFILALLACFYAAGEIIFPVVLAFFLKLVLQPVMRFFERLFIPRMLAALFIILILLGAFAGIGTALSVPAANWAHELPDEFPKLKQRINSMRAPMKPIQNVIEGAQDLAGPKDPRTMTVTMQGASLSDRLLQHTRHFVSALFETLLVLFFMLVSGDTFLRRLVEVLPRFKDKKQAVNISNQIQADISAYLTTITLMNAGVGVVTAVIMQVCGVEDAALWGIAAFLLNFIPIVGPIIALGLFIVVGLTLNSDISMALLPAGLYLGIHLIEGEIVTPMVLARRFTLNPVLVILGVIFWYWMWGVPGAILSTPMLAITKIICDHIQSLRGLGHFIEG
jgi:predicted PurR-regulated permease PerM